VGSEGRPADRPLQTLVAGTLDAEPADRSANTARRRHSLARPAMDAKSRQVWATPGQWMADRGADTIFRYVMESPGELPATPDGPTARRPDGCSISRQVASSKSISASIGDRRCAAG